MGIISQLKQYFPWLQSVCLTGSRTLPWIQDPHDNDLVLYVDGIDKLLAEEILAQKEENDCIRFCDINTVNLVRIYSYQYHFLQPLLGTNIPHYDIFEHVEEQKREMLRYVDRGILEKSPKRWYHILTTIYMLDNGKYELTDEQIKNVNLCHDYKMTEELYTYIQGRLEEYKDELGI